MQVIEIYLTDNRLELLTARKVYIKKGSNITIEIKTNDDGNSEWNFRKSLNEKSALQFVDPDANDNIIGNVFKIKDVSLKHEGYYEFVYKVDQCTSVIEVEVIVFTGVLLIVHFTKV